MCVHCCVFGAFDKSVPPPPPSPKAVPMKVMNGRLGFFSSCYEEHKSTSFKSVSESCYSFQGVNL